MTVSPKRFGEFVGSPLQTPEEWSCLIWEVKMDNGLTVHVLLPENGQHGWYVEVVDEDGSLVVGPDGEDLGFAGLTEDAVVLILDHISQLTPEEQ